MTFTHWDGPPVHGQRGAYLGFDVVDDHKRASQIGITIALTMAIPVGVPFHVVCLLKGTIFFWPHPVLLVLILQLDLGLVHEVIKRVTGAFQSQLILYLQVQKVDPA